MAYAGRPAARNDDYWLSLARGMRMSHLALSVCNIYDITLGAQLLTQIDFCPCRRQVRNLGQGGPATVEPDDRPLTGRCRDSVSK